MLCVEIDSTYVRFKIFGENTEFLKLNGNKGSEMYGEGLRLKKVIVSSIYSQIF